VNDEPNGECGKLRRLSAEEGKGGSPNAKWKLIYINSLDF
jgi:hypothetical protein